MQTLPSQTGLRCSDRGFLNLTTVEYIQLLDWTARQVVAGKRGSTPELAPPIFERLKLGMSPDTFGELVGSFGKLFKLVAGKPSVVDAHRSQRRRKRFRMDSAARRLLEV
ncbi:MAG: hypothetical protein KF752_00715 [Pirellulaceae bacterium]|nr:hypothetical protein [Pirellulaceae bacterium]